MKAKRLSKDRISTLPSILIENILCLVPIRDAVRTSILSRNWRYNWATIPKLVFNVYDMFDESHEELQLELAPENEMKQLTRKCKVFYAIFQVLLLHHGPILEFNLSMLTYKNCVEIDQIMLHLSRKNTVKKLTIDLEFVDSFLAPYLYRLPLSVFSLHQLTDLSLSGCEFEFIPTVNGFSSLTSLSLVDVKSCGDLILHLISLCPLLKHFCLILGDPEDNEYAFTLDFSELLDFLPVIEHLCISSWTVEEYFAPRNFLTTLVHLKSLSMCRMQLDYKLYYLFILIKRSPNLEKIEIQQEKFEHITELLTDHEMNSLDDYSDIWLEHLNELEIYNFTVSKLELEFVKFILAKSPMLKKVRIVLATWVENDEELKMLRILLCCPRASLVTETIVERP